MTSGRWRLGLALALATGLLWSTLAIILKSALEQIDAWSLTWFRFALAFAFFAVWVAVRKRPGRLRELEGREWLVLVVAAAMLTTNYMTYLTGLDYTTPANAQLLIQLAPLSLAIGGFVFFRERFTRPQWLGAVVLLSGLGLFFRDQLTTFSASRASYLIGSSFIMAAALSWAIYALCQKRLLAVLGAPTVLMFIFGFATVVLLPWVDFGVFAGIDAWHWAAVLYCGINTVAAYSAFSQALVHVEASRVSAVLAINPLLTLACVAAAHATYPDVFPEAYVTSLGILGAFVAVGGSMLTTLSPGQRTLSKVSESGVARDA